MFVFPELQMREVREPHSCVTLCPAVNS